MAPAALVAPLLMGQVVLVVLPLMAPAAPAVPPQTGRVVPANYRKGDFVTMLTLDVYSNSSLGSNKPAAARNGLHRLFAAAIVNNQFRETLLREPEAALANGYLGQPFALTDQERTIIQSVRAKTLTDLAQKVNQALKAI